MEKILSIEDFLNESYQRKMSGEEMNKKLFRFFEKIFYEIKDKRYDEPYPHQLEVLTPESREYLLDVLDVLKDYDRTYPRLGEFIDPQTSKPVTTEDGLITYLASNFFCGFGRASRLGSSLQPIQGLRLPEPPSQEVVENLVKFAQSR